MENATNKMEAERLLTTAEKLLANRDFTSSKDFAILAQETDPLLEGSDQIAAIVDVLLSAEKRVNNHPDWYAVLQVAPRSTDLDLIKKQYRRLALLLHPDKNKFPFADSAFRLVADSWAALSDPAKKSAVDAELGVYFAKVDLEESRKNRGRQQNFSAGKLPVRRNSSAPDKRGRPKKSVGVGAGIGVGSNVRPKESVGVGAGIGVGSNVRAPNFWTACPYCYHLFEYPRMYTGYCLVCNNCEKSFTADPVVAMPPMVPGKEEYYCCWGMFPMGFSEERLGRGKSVARGFANWMPPMQSSAAAAAAVGVGDGSGVKEIPKAAPVTSVDGKRRGRPRKYPL